MLEGFVVGGEGEKGAEDFLDAPARAAVSDAEAAFTRALDELKDAPSTAAAFCHEGVSFAVAGPPARTDAAEVARPVGRELHRPDHLLSAPVDQPRPLDATQRRTPEALRGERPPRARQQQRQFAANRMTDRREEADVAGRQAIAAHHEDVLDVVAGLRRGGVAVVGARGRRLHRHQQPGDR